MRNTLIMCTVLLMIAVPCVAKVVVKKGTDYQIDTSRIPAQMRDNYKLMLEKCTRCHSLDRILSAIDTGIVQSTAMEYNAKTIHEYGLKMLRKKSSHMTKEDVRKVSDLLIFMVNEQQK